MSLREAYLIMDTFITHITIILYLYFDPTVHFSEGEGVRWALQPLPI
jgi:hypothetical protein